MSIQSATPVTIYPCQLHDDEHLYAVCAACGKQFCPHAWSACPRCHHTVRRSPGDEALSRIAAMTPALALLRSRAISGELTTPAQARRILRNRGLPGPAPIDYGALVDANFRAGC